MKSTLLTALIFLGLIAQSQPLFRWGIVGGVNASKIITDTKTKSLNGYHAGLITEIKTPAGVGVELDVLFSSKGTVAERLDSNLVATNYDYRLNYLDFPIVLKKYFLKVFNIHAGPQFSYLLSANRNGDNLTSNFNSFDIAAVVGLELDVKIAKASIRYNYGLTEINNEGGKNSVLQITLGIWVK